jgi:N-acyl-D-aspartate/D-glutamate deacylase
MKADCNIIDLESLRVHLPEMVDDFPRHGRRLVQRADGYVATIVHGEVVRDHGVTTDARPGRIVRSQA